MILALNNRQTQSIAGILHHHRRRPLAGQMHTSATRCIYEHPDTVLGGSKKKEKERRDKQEKQIGGKGEKRVGAQWDREGVNIEESLNNPNTHRER